MTEFEKAYIDEMKRHNQAMERIEERRNTIRTRFNEMFAHKSFK